MHKDHENIGDNSKNNDFKSCTQQLRTFLSFQTQMMAIVAKYRLVSRERAFNFARNYGSKLECRDFSRIKLDR